MRVTVIDYKAGNLTSVLKALRHVGAEAVVTDSDLSVLESAERIVLPGVGHFAATERLDATGLTPAIRAAIARGVPFLGICVGMQWLYAGSSEAPQQRGLAHFAESCARFTEGTEKVPHVGWNSLEVRPRSCLLAGVEPGEFVYFTHSYKAPVTADTAPSRTTSSPSRRRSSAATSWAYSFIPRSPARLGSKSSAIFSTGKGRELHADQANHRLPRRARRPCRQGRAVRRSHRCRRPCCAGCAPRPRGRG